MKHSEDIPVAIPNSNWLNWRQGYPRFMYSPAPEVATKRRTPWQPSTSDPKFAKRTWLEIPHQNGGLNGKIIYDGESVGNTFW